MKERGIAAHSFVHLDKIFYIVQAPVSIQTAKLTNVFEKLTKLKNDHEHISADQKDVHTCF